MNTKKIWTILALTFLSIALITSCSGNGYGSTPPGTKFKINNVEMILVTAMNSNTYDYLACPTTPAYMTSLSDYGVNFNTPNTKFPWTEFKYVQAPSNVISEANGIDIGTGMSNTEILETRTNANQFEVGNTTVTAIASKVSQKDSIDWFIPSLDEMKAISEAIMNGTINPPKKPSSSFQFWTSSEYSSNFVNTVLFEYNSEHNATLYYESTARFNGEAYVWPVTYVTQQQVDDGLIVTP